MTTKKFLRFLIPTVIVLVTVPFLQKIKTNKVVEYNKLNCLIALKNYHSQNMSFDVGYNYEMLQRFANDIHTKIDIGIYRDKGNILDSLQNDSLSIVVIPYTDTLIDKSEYKISQRLTDGTIWVVNSKNKDLASAIDTWIVHCQCSPDYKDLVERFTPSYNPQKRAHYGIKAKNISPYDKYIKQYAKQIGWDWRMFAALIWQESKFRIEVQSPRGATGMMQLMPRTLKHFSVDDAINPEISIKTGAKLLHRLDRIFSKYAEGTELYKIVLAAYNAGEGRIIQCMNYAIEHKLPHSHWTDIEHVMNVMREDKNLQNENNEPLFKGYETIDYVNGIIANYYAICAIAPEQNVLDLHGKQKDTVSKAKPLSQNKIGTPPKESSTSPSTQAHKKENNSKDQAAKNGNSLPANKKQKQ